MAVMIVFTCTSCSDDFEMPVQTFIDIEAPFVTAPTLCGACDDSAEDDYFGVNCQFPPERKALGR